MIGALGGAAAGAAIGAATGSAGTGAAIGAAAGATTGAAAGGVYKYSTSQEGYDRAVADCMAQRGYRAGQVTQTSVTTTTSSAPPSPPVTAPAATAVTATAPSRINLLARENGGELVITPNDLWVRTIDGREEAITWFYDGEEAVFGFRNDQPATFDTFSILVPDTGDNVKELELSVSDSMTGPFRAIGRIQPLNAKIVRTGGYQDFTFAPATARYLKIKLVSGVSGSNVSPGRTAMKLHEFRLFGSPSAASSAR